MNKNLKYLLEASMLTAVIAVCAQIAIPIGEVPINLALFGVWMCIGLLPMPYALLSVALYLVLGAVGVPVFSPGATTGLARFVSPTGGYLIGYLAAVPVGSLIIKLGKEKLYSYIIGLLCGFIVCTVLGLAWYCFSTGSPIVPALGVCVIPFIPGDILKIAAACLIIQAVKKRLFIKG